MTKMDRKILQPRHHCNYHNVDTFGLGGEETGAFIRRLRYERRSKTHTFEGSARCGSRRGQGRGNQCSAD